VPHAIEIVVPAGQGKERIDLFLTNHLQNATRSKVQHGIRSGAVLVNGQPVRPSYHVSGGEIIRVVLPSPPPQEALPEAIPLAVVYEDETLLVVNKPAGMVTHPGHGNPRGTLVNALLHHCRSLSSLNGPARAGIVHRLDKDTTGLMVVAKDDGAHARLARQFERRTIEREYWAIVWGVFRQRTGVIEAPLGRSRSDRKKIAVVEDGKHAVTHYEVLEEFDYLTLVRLQLRTGRTHQIRVHLAHIHHPVFGDPTYNGKRIMYGPGTSSQRADVQAMLRMIERQALHAKTIAFVHPATNRRCAFDSPLPDDMAEILSFLRSSGGS
jgi:23S rRNA pseudouridine1911/1915/1917 synthase